MVNGVLDTNVLFGITLILLLFIIFKVLHIFVLLFNYYVNYKVDNLTDNICLSNCDKLPIYAQ